MSPQSKGNPGCSNLPLTNGTPLYQTTNSFVPQSSSILENARNFQINNGVFTTNTTNTSTTVSPLAVLHNCVATNAILNYGGRADEVRCYPGTREEVIGLVEKSISQEYTGPRLLWLSGPAGAGKSAIMQTVAEKCKKEGVPHANFFFFRADSSRMNATPFVATIMHQIIRCYPSVGSAVEATLTSNPLLFRMSIQNQFDELLHQALATMHDTLPPLPPLTLLIDGLDECDSENKTEQRQLLQAVDTLLTQRGLHYRVVIASRVEPQISMVFSQLRSRVDSIFLDEKYSPEKDIHRFVTAEFDKIKSSHYLASTLGPEWPSESDVAGIVLKSSGQFIFAATVMRFIAHSPASPILSLQKVQGIVLANKNSPFSQLDAVYAYILEQVEDWEAVKALLSIRLLENEFNHLIPDLMLAYQSRFSRAVFDSCLPELAPLVYMKDDKLELFHASFTDFLHDQNRSRDSHVDLDKFCIAAVPFWWRKQSSVSVSAVAVALNKVTQPTAEITAAFMECAPDSDYLYSDMVTISGTLHTIYAYDLQTLAEISRLWMSRNPELGTIFPLKFRLYAMPESSSPMSSSTPLIPPSTVDIPQLVFDHEQPPFISQLSPLGLPHSSASMTDQPASLMNPYTHQTYPSTSHMHSSMPHIHPSTPQTHLPASEMPIPNPQMHSFFRQTLPDISQMHQITHQIPPSIHQVHSSTHHIPPPVSWAHPSVLQTHPPTSQTYPPLAQMQPFTHRMPPLTNYMLPPTNHMPPPANNMRPFVDLANSSALWTYPSTHRAHAFLSEAHAFFSEAHSFLSKAHAFVSEALPLISQMDQVHHQMHPSMQQAHSSTFETHPSTMPHQSASQGHPSSSQVYPPGVQRQPYVWQMPPSADQGQSYNPSTSTHHYR